MGVAIIQQEITAGNDFDGTLPSTDPTQESDYQKKFPEDTAGGLFDFELDNPAEIFSIELQLGGQSSWQIVKRDIDGDDTVIWSGSTETSFITLASDRILITEGELLLLTTTGATAQLKAKIAVEKIRS